MLKITHFDECCFDAQNFDENCDLLYHKPNKESGESSKNMETHALIDLILQKLRQELNLIQPSHAYNPSVPHQNGEKWCNFCVKWTNHEWHECQNRARYLRERAFQALHVQSRDVQSKSEKIPRPSLGVQPLRPSAALMSHIENKNELALVPFQSYHARDEPRTSKSLGYQPKDSQLEQAMHCYQCHGPHWTKDYPLEPEDKPRDSSSNWPELPRFCAGCAIDHLGKNCPNKPRDDNDKGKRTFLYVEVIPSPNSSENESEVVSLRVVNRVPVEKALDEPLIETKEEPVLQEIPLEEQLKSKWKNQNKHAKSKKTNLQKAKEQENSSGTDTLESSSWESIVLETPDGVRREFIVKPSTETKLAQGEIKPEAKT